MERGLGRAGRAALHASFFISALMVKDDMVRTT